jgi:hypothetical protein
MTAVTTVERATLLAWFERYHRSFAVNDPYVRANFDLKIAHTHRVCRYMDELTAALGLDAHTRVLALAVALFHDIGRFEQFTRHRTFNDRLSERHGPLGAAVLEREAALAGLPPGERERVLAAVRHHADLEPPAGDGAGATLLRLIRDADKIDIIAILAEYYATQVPGSNPAIELEMPDNPGCSPAVVAAVLAGKLVDYGQMQTLTDFKIGQLSWVFDINYDYSLQRIRGFGFPECIMERIPHHPDNDAICQYVRTYMARRDSDRHIDRGG